MIGFCEMNYEPYTYYFDVSPELDADMVFGYRYDGGYISHQPKIISSVSDDEDVTLMGWNTNGQMTSMVQPNQDRFRKHMWDEAGQLPVAIGNEYCGYYGYNANGERAYKLTGTVLADQYDAGDVNIETYFDDIVLYVNPYMVVTPRGYTKHYYNGSQRIAARLGDYWAASVADESGMVAYAREVLEQTMNSSDIEEEHFEEKYVRSIDGEEFYLEPFTLYTHYRTCSYSEDMLYEALNGGARLADHIGGIDQGIFYYHPDHLGSSSWITDDQGEAVQYLHYMPFGELWENQQPSEYDERFKFTGKERDTETGYDYFGARYYASTLPMWLSVDPLSDDYPNITPYAYCNWNPVKYVDPTGEWIAVTSNDDTGTSYTVVGGSVDVEDCSVYVVGNDYDTKSGVKPQGANILAQTATPYSFSNEKGEIVTGSVIDMSDKSGDAFIARFQNNEIPLFNYIFDNPKMDGNLSGRNGGNCDFKFGGDVNRGMPLSILGGKIGTARDVGNFAAGYLSGVHGIPFSLTRIAFDCLQRGIEPPVSMSAQNIGYFTGYYQFLTQQKSYYGAK